MLALLQVVAGPDKGRSAALGHGLKEALGRSPEGRLKLQDPKVSRVHCYLSVEEGVARLTDAGGTGGTWVNGVRISEQELKPGDMIRIGETEIQFHWSDMDQLSTEQWPPPRGT